MICCTVKPPNNALIGTLCDGVRMAREYLAYVQGSTLAVPRLEAGERPLEQAMENLPHQSISEWQDDDYVPVRWVRLNDVLAALRAEPVK